MKDINQYYGILGLKPGDSPDEVKDAYRDLVKVWHPDRFAHDPKLQVKAQEKLKEINEAYQKIQDFLDNLNAYQQATGTNTNESSETKESANTNTKQSSETKKREDKSSSQHKKIGGWLILVAIGLVLTPLRFLVVVVNDLLPVFSGETWSILTTPGTEAYHPFSATLLIFELIGNIAFVVFAIVVAIFFFKRRKIVPKLMIAFLFSNLAFVVIDYFVADSIPFIASQNDPESLRELIRVLIGCLIWVPYFLVSKRVKGTFVN